MGFETWAEAYEEAARRRRMLQAAGAKLTRPKLVASYAHWQRDWAAEAAAAATMTLSERLAAEHAELQQTQAELARTRGEATELADRLRELDGGAAERELLLKRQLEEERERRVEHLKQVRALVPPPTSRVPPPDSLPPTAYTSYEYCPHPSSSGRTAPRQLTTAAPLALPDSQVAIRRIALRDLSKGWAGWHDAWEEVVRQRNLLKQAGARLTRPKLVASYQRWRRDWDATMAALAARTARSTEETAASLKAQKAALEVEATQLRAELAEARHALARGEGAEIEERRRAAEREAREKEKRVEHLGEMAARRMGRKELSAGWSAWLDMYETNVRRRQMLVQVSGRLLRPKLVNGYVHWRQSWQLDQVAQSKMTVKERLEQERAKRAQAESAITSIRSEGEVCVPPPTPPCRPALPLCTWPSLATASPPLPRACMASCLPLSSDLHSVAAQQRASCSERVVSATAPPRCQLTAAAPPPTPADEGQGAQGGP